MVISRTRGFCVRSTSPAEAEVVLSRRVVPGSQRFPPAQTQAEQQVVAVWRRATEVCAEYSPPQE